jgi:ribonuclease Y
LQSLEERAGVRRQAALGRTVRERVGRYELTTARRLRRSQEHNEQNAVVLARRVMAVAVDRYHGVGHLERIQNTIFIPDRRTLLALGDPTGPAHTIFVERIGCELWCDEAAGALTVRGDDPLGREVARRVLRQLANRSISEPDRVQEITEVVLDEVQREVHNAARKAIRALGLGPMDPAISELVGRLKFRLSYSQNQWKHAIEVGYLAGILAEELGLDVRLARRGGLLHDIGKALTHEREGSHAVLGAEVARRCGEHEIVANAIGSHHFDEPPATPLAYVVTAADAMSGARPGARRESAQSSVDRIRAIHEIAGRAHAMIERVDIMSAGREVRVIVGADERGDTEARAPAQVLRDADLYPLAQRIARELEEEITFAGQIRVTVIRESRSVTIAR